MKPGRFTDWIYITCEHYTQLASRSLDEPLSARDKFAFWVHHIICTFCRRFYRQLRLVDQAGAEIEKTWEQDQVKSKIPNNNDNLTDESKRRIKQAVEQAAE